MDEPLPKFILLVPLNYNDGTEVPEDVILEFQEALYGLGGAFTIAGTVKGTYRMADGTRQSDELLQIWIGLEEELFPQLEQAVAQLGAKLGQESMYLERTGGMIHFIQPRPSRGGEP